MSATLKWAAKNHHNVTVIGGGTNVLVSDRGIGGLVVSLSKFSGIEIVDDKENLKFWTLAGTPKSEILKLFLKHKLDPALFLAGLPGQVGGGVVMNAGVSEKLKPREFHEITEAIEVLRPDGQTNLINSAQLNWSYRHCEGWRPGVISRVLLSWPKVENPKVLEEVKKLNQGRLKKQPLELPSCGSVFRNPLPRHAGQLIEEVGLKGHQIGGAQISLKHANFIVNLGSAKAADVKALMELCVQRVKEKTGIDLQSEVVWLGLPL